jgi:hypothetical protein
MNVEIATVAVQFLFWEYLVRISGIGSLQCSDMDRKKMSYSEVLQDFIAGNVTSAGQWAKQNWNFIFCWLKVNKIKSHRGK